MKKKSFFVVVFLAIVAIVLTIVFVNLFNERDTEALSETVNQYVESGYINEEDEAHQIIQDYLDNISVRLLENSDTTAEGRQAQNYGDFLESINTLGDFINNQLVYGKYSDVYKSNKKAIENCLKTAQAKATKLAQTIEDEKSVVGESNYWTINTWQEHENDIVVLFEKTNSAFDKLLKVYSSCVESKLLNNSLTDVVFSRLGDLFAQLKNSSAEDDAIGAQISEFVEYYLSNVEPILNYSYNSNLQIKIEDIKAKGEDSEYYSDFCECLIDIEVA